MFGRSVKLFRLWGFEVKVDASWLLLALLIVWTLVGGYFPHLYPGRSTALYVGMGIAALAGIFISIVLHEYAHSHVARRNGIRMRGITLFLFGGVAEMESEPLSASTEFKIAIAGPLMSVFLSGVFLAVELSSLAYGSIPVAKVFGYLALINVMLAAFNMIPAFPLDGGRVLRSILWAIQKDSHRATITAASIGSGFGFVLVALGLAQAFRGDIVGGLWLLLIGMFLRGAARNAARHVRIQEVLKNETLSSFMNPDPVTLSPETTLEEFVDNYVYRYNEPSYPVTDGKMLLGTISISQLNRVPREQWSGLTVGDVLQECSPQNTVSNETHPSNVLALMSTTGSSRVLVSDHHCLAGVVSLESLLRFLSVKLDLQSAGVGTNTLNRASSD